MNKHLKGVMDIVQQLENLSVDQKDSITESIKVVDKELQILSFKLDRTEKVKRTTTILLEETIEELDRKRKTIEESHSALSKSLKELKAAQAQLIQSEKMASLGELTAGIAHEIQNPLNFVNNFSEVSVDLVTEMNEEMEDGDFDEAQAISNDLKQNLEKISHHGKRASGIVKGMLEHSRASDGQKELIDINALVDEYLRLAYHGIRAKDKSFNADFKTDLDNEIPKIKVIPQDIGRVFLNLINNAFHACSERSRIYTERSRSAVDEMEIDSDKNFKPLVSISTSKKNDRIIIEVKDNGNGIAESIREKIFQPFFTTKPTGQGTGLGLSLSHDIVKTHRGEISVDSNQNMGTVFTINLPINN